MSIILEEIDDYYFEALPGFPLEYTNLDEDGYSSASTSSSISSEGHLSADTPSPVAAVYPQSVSEASPSLAANDPPYSDATQSVVAVESPLVFSGQSDVATSSSPSIGASSTLAVVASPGSFGQDVKISRDNDCPGINAVSAKTADNEYQVSSSKVEYGPSTSSQQAILTFMDMRFGSNSKSFVTATPSIYTASPSGLGDSRSHLKEKKVTRSSSRPKKIKMLLPSNHFVMANNGQQDLPPCLSVCGVTLACGHSCNDQCGIDHVHSYIECF